MEIGRELAVAVLIPCFNEEAAIGTVVADMRQALPNATIYVYDNNSTDRTRQLAREAGAVVRTEPRQGKGYVVRRMFADIEADIYVMVDGDATYDARAAGSLVSKLVTEGLDMVNGAREETADSAYRVGHKFGNKLLTGLVRAIFGSEFHDMLSGYRVFSRRFVKSFPVMSAGFEIETELTIHALGLEMPSAEVRTAFSERMAGSASKLRTFADGFRILWTIVKLLKQERPMALFGAAAAILMVVSVVLAYPIFVTFFETGLVPRFPTAILATGLILLSFLSLACGLILDTVTRGRQEAKRMCYNGIPGVHAAAASTLTSSRAA
ncbi:glycosyltransferase family 2 protein [Desertibaculum subflavum]|uniref:glycosyltransferase family 2 protein n=1 Tax=Desertibaculum subflavum TaxID=2268458 RepID=UPI000E671701